MIALVANLDIKNLIKKCIHDGIISIDDVMNSSEEVIMNTILKNHHKYEITQLSDGRYCTYVPDEAKPNGRRQIRKKSITDLYKFLIHYYGLTNTEKCNMTFGELYSAWVDYKKKFIGAPNAKKSLSPSTIHRYELDFKNYIFKSELAQTAIIDITVPFLEGFLLSMIEDNGMNDRCASNVIGYLNQAFDFAKKSRFIKENPMDSIDKRLMLSRCVCDPPKMDEERILKKTDIIALKKALSDHEEKHPDYMPNYAIEMALLTGMRVGELAALKWSCIDDVYIHIDFSEHRLDFHDKPSEFVIGDPKNRKHRLFPLTKPLRELIAKIKSVKTTAVSDFVFTTNKGDRCTAREIGAAARRRCSEAGISHGSIHRIRRTVSSILNKVSAQKDVAALIGNSELVNEMYYNYSTAELKDKLSALNFLSTEMFDFKNERVRKKA